MSTVCTHPALNLEPLEERRLPAALAASSLVYIDVSAKLEEDAFALEVTPLHNKLDAVSKAPLADERVANVVPRPEPTPIADASIEPLPESTPAPVVQTPADPGAAPAPLAEAKQVSLPMFGDKSQEGTVLVAADRLPQASQANADVHAVDPSLSRKAASVEMTPIKQGHESSAPPAVEAEAGIANADAARRLDVPAPIFASEEPPVLNGSSADMIVDLPLIQIAPFDGIRQTMPLTDEAPSTALASLLPISSWTDWLVVSALSCLTVEWLRRQALSNTKVDLRRRELEPELV